MSCTFSNLVTTVVVRSLHGACLILPFVHSCSFTPLLTHTHTAVGMAQPRCSWAFCPLIAAAVGVTPGPTAPDVVSALGVDLYSTTVCLLRTLASQSLPAATDFSTEAYVSSAIQDRVWVALQTAAVGTPYATDVALATSRIASGREAQPLPSTRRLRQGYVVTADNSGTLYVITALDQDASLVDLRAVSSGKEFFRIPRSALAFVDHTLTALHPQTLSSETAEPVPASPGAAVRLGPGRRGVARPRSPDEVTPLRHRPQPVSLTSPRYGSPCDPTPLREPTPLCDPAQPLSASSLPRSPSPTSDTSTPSIGSPCAPRIPSDATHSILTITRETEISDDEPLAPALLAAAGAPPRLANPQPGCSCRRKERTQGRQGRHTLDCQITRWSALRKRDRLGALGAFNAFRRTPSPAGALSAASAPRAAVLLDTPPSLELDPVARARILLVSRIPSRARAPFAAALYDLASQLSASDSSTWTHLFAFPKCVLWKPPHGDIADAIIARCRRWRTADPATRALMFTEACANMPSRAIIQAESLRDAAASALARAERLLRSGAFAKGIAALNSHAPVEPSEAAAELMSALHPADGPPPPPPPAAITPVSAPKFTCRQVRGALRSFPLGSSGGLSGLKPQILVDAASHTSSQAVSATTIIVNLLAAGSVPHDVSPYFFGATLTAIPKSATGLRPIASGDVFRRIAGKLLANAATPAEEFLKARRQIGIRTPNGIEAAQLGARRYANGMMPGKVMLKGDIKNAFNSLWRATFLEVLSHLVPGLCPYAFAAYASPSVLYFGDFKIMSRAGVQQGDPLGPLFFSIAIALIRDRVFQAMPPELRDAIDFEVSYLDDLTVAGSAPAVRSFLTHLVAVSAQFGLHLNMNKTELIHHPDECPEVLELFTEVGKRFTSLDFTLLGAPCGTDLSAASAAVASACAAHISKLKSIGLLTHSQIAYAALRFCGAQPLANYHARAVGSIASTHFADLDSATIAAFASTAVHLDRDTQSIARLPARLGGLGFRSVQLIAPVAFICSAASAAPCLKALFSDAAYALLAPDPFQKEAASLDTLLRSPPFADIAKDLDTLCSQASSRDPPAQPRRLQRHFTQRIEDVQRALLFGCLSQIAQARLQSCSAPMASSWLAPLPGSDDPLWLPSSAFITLVRFRLGLPIAAAQSHCVMCGETADPYGYHSITCASGRYGLHNTVRDSIFAMAQAANWAPTLEPHIIPEKWGTRADILARIGPNMNQADVYAIDVAVIAPHAKVWLHSAIDHPAGAASRYEEQKVRHYGSRHDHPGVSVIGCVVDMFGAWGEQAVALITKLAHAWGHRFDLHPSRAVPLVFGALSTRFQSGVAKLLLANNQTHCPSDPLLDRALSAVPLLAGVDVEPALTQRGLIPT
jgi:hypothetical protein